VAVEEIMMTSSPVLQENAKNKPQNRGAGPGGISVLSGVLWMVGAAGVWILLLVLLHNVMARLL
jgi:hypothetical protein